MKEIAGAMQRSQAIFPFPFPSSVFAEGRRGPLEAIWGQEGSSLWVYRDITQVAPPP